MTIDRTSDHFNARFTAWLRIEPRCRQDNFEQGVQARTADPLWMLARQWQTGEFRGEDAGSPIEVSLGYSSQSVDRISLGDTVSVVADANVPLEKVVEQELAPLNYRERVRVGQEFERRLRARLDEIGQLAELTGLVTALREDDALGFPSAPRAPLHKLDRATQRFVRFMQGRVIDGAAILAGQIDDPVPQPLIPQVEKLRLEIVEWYAQVCTRPASKLPHAWQAESLDYRFETNNYPDDVAADSHKTRLVAPDYRNGAVDWYTFSAGAEGARNWETTAEHFGPHVTTPTRIELFGTSPRWWAFEDGNTHLGAMDVAKPDLAKLLLLEFDLIYGDDWFSVPVPVDQGSLTRIDEIRVTNVFGDNDPVDPASKTTGLPTERFDLYTISPADNPIAPGMMAGTPTRPLLLVPSISGFRQESDPIEEVQFLRDEGANQVWGIEQQVQNGIGRVIAGFDAQTERLQRMNEVERAGLEALIEDVQQQLESNTLTDPERAQQLHKQAQLAMARIAELDPYATSTPSQKDIPRYKLATTVPENWMPFIPDRSRVSEFAIELRRAKVLRNTDHAKLDGITLTPDVVQDAARRLGLPDNTFQWMSGSSALEHIPSMSRLLALDEDALLWLNEEAVPRAGLRVQLTKQRMRWLDGSTHVWLGRKVLTGRGEGESGLIFDIVKDR